MKNTYQNSDRALYAIFCAKDAGTKLGHLREKVSFIFGDEAPITTLIDQVIEDLGFASSILNDINIEDNNQRDCVTFRKWVCDPREKDVAAPNTVDDVIGEKTIDDIIGDFKTYEPPFYVDYDGTLQERVLSDGYGAVMLTQESFWVTGTSQKILMLKHFCDLLNKEHCTEDDK